MSTSSAKITVSPEEYSSSIRQSALFTITKYVPMFSWLPRYNRLQAASDLIAGITVGLTIIPQSIAYAALAELTAQVLFLFFSIDRYCL